jgi:arylsulfatase A-like enzyme
LEGVFPVVAVPNNRLSCLPATVCTLFLLALLVWGADLALATPPEPEPALAALFFLLTPLIPGSVLLGFFLHVLLGGENPYSAAGRGMTGLIRYLAARDRPAGFRFLVASLSLAVYAAGAIGLSWLLCRAIADGIAMARYQAILSVAATLGSLIAMLPAGLFCWRLGRLLEAPLATVPYLSALWGRPLWPCLLDAAAIAAAKVLFFLKFEEAVLLSPWQKPALFLGLSLAAALLAAPLCRLAARRRPAAILAAVIALVTLLSGAAALRLPLVAPEARERFLAMPGTGLAYSALNRLLDRDGDGAMHAFAGGDCAPDDPAISPAAVDVPGNGVDEDCDGHDVRFASLEAGRWDFRVPAAFARRRLPVLIVSSDALSALHTSIHGYERDTTPNLAAWARRCVVFDKAFSQGPSTRLSLGAFFTGLFDSQTEVLHKGKVPYPFADSNLTLAEIFRMHGYETVAVVPNDYFYARWKGILQGFDTIDKGGAKTKKRADEIVHNASKVTAAAIRQLRKKRDKPLFMWAHYYDNHYPFGQPKGGTVFGKSRMDKYDAEIELVDKHMARLLAKIDETFGQGGYLLIVTSDHGSAFDERHPTMSQGFDLYTSVLHIPMMFCSTAMPPRRVTATPVTLMDLPPTLVNLFGFKVKTAFEGTSLVPLLFDDVEWPDRYVFHQFFLPEKLEKDEDPLYAASVHTADYNYIWDRKAGKYELFDWVNDPLEKENLVLPNQDVFRTLDSVLKTWLHRVHKSDRLPVKKAPGRRAKRPAKEVEDGNREDLP